MTLPARPARRRNAALTRQTLMDAGEDLFAAHGFAATTLDAIAATAGVNKAMIRYYFADKEGLYTAIVETIIDDVLAHFEQALEGDGEPVSGMGDFIEVFAASIIARPNFPRMLLRDYLDGDIMTREGPAARLRSFLDTTRRFYEAGHAAGRFRDVDVHMLHLSIVGAAIFFSLTDRIRTRVVRHPGMADLALEPTAFARHLRQLILSGIET